MIQIGDLIILAVVVWAIESMLKIRMRGAGAAVAVAALVIVEYLLMFVCRSSAGAATCAYVIVILINPALEESVRVRHSPIEADVSITSFLSTSLMIGCVEGALKIISFSISYPQIHFAEAGNVSILLSGLLSVLLHLNFGIILFNIDRSDRIMAFVKMAAIHALYNFVVIESEPREPMQRLIHLGLLAAVNLTFFIYHAPWKNSPERRT